MAKEIDEDIEHLRKEVVKDRIELGPYPLTSDELEKWERLCDLHRDLAKSINNKINTYNLIVPLINKQKFHVDIEGILDDVLQNGANCLDESTSREKNVVKKIDPQFVAAGDTEDIFGLFFKAVIELLTFKKEKQ